MSRELSLIVISYNRKNELRKCLDSICQQKTYSDFETIVIDQGSTDGSLELINEYIKKDARFSLDIFKNKSLNAKRNRGIKIASSSIIGFVDDDCLLDKKWIDSCLSVFQGNKNILALTGRILPLNKGFKRSIRLSTKRKIWGKGWLDRVVCWRCGCGNNFVIHKKIVESVGLFDETIGAGTALGGGADDTEYFYRILSKGFYIYYIPEIIVFHPQPINFEDYKRRSYFYYKGVSLFVRKKYLSSPSAILMVTIRLLHSILFLFIGCLTFRRNDILNKKEEIRGTVDGLLLR